MTDLCACTNRPADAHTPYPHAQALGFTHTCIMPAALCMHTDSSPLGTSQEPFTNRGSATERTGERQKNKKCLW